MFKISIGSRPTAFCLRTVVGNPNSVFCLWHNINSSVLQSLPHLSSVVRVRLISLGRAVLTRQHTCVISCKSHPTSDLQVLDLLSIRRVDTVRRLSTSRMYSSKAQCMVGDIVQNIETPALLVCLDKLEQNLQYMTTLMTSKYPNVSLRPHGKAHKCPNIAQKQIKLAAVGICCQTLSEAEAMVAGGIHDIFISNQMIGARKLQRLACLATSTCLSVCVDNEQNIHDLSSVAVQFNVYLDLVVEVNVGGQRCGVEPGPDVLKLVQKINNLPQINFKGLHCYNGLNQHIRCVPDRKAAVDKVVEKVKTVLNVLKDAGIECHYVTGGGSGTFHYEAQSGVFTEVQPGSYIFMDVDYCHNLDEYGQPVTEFKQSLFVLGTIQSNTPGSHSVVDAGMKALSLDSGPPQVRSSEKVQVYHSGGDEHGVIRPGGNYKVGEQMWLVPGHCDPTVNMYDWLIGLRNGCVESIWPITGRGPGV